MIHTAGRYLTEQELRTYTKCSQLHFYEGEIEASPVIQLAQYAFEALTSHSIRKDILDPLHLMQKYLYRGAKELGFVNKYMDNQVQSFIRKATTLLGDLFLIFSFEQYIPVFPPMDYIVKVSKTPIKLYISGIYRSTQNQTLHIVCFSPYTNEDILAADPTVVLKLQTLKKVVKEHYSGRPQAKLHIIAASSQEDRLLYSSRDSGEVPKSTVKQIKKMIQQMETGAHYPLVPCPYSCKFRRRCFS